VPVRVARPDPLELAILSAFALVSLWILGLDLWQVVAHARVWTGADSIYGVDQYQYMAWVRDASKHVLVSNLFVLRPTPADYFQPAIALSGGLVALGLAPSLSLLIWKPLAVVALFWATRGYVRRSLAGAWSRRAALALALFFGSFTFLYGSVGTIGDLFPGFLSWGYPFALLALAAMVAGLLAYDRAVRQGAISCWPGVLGAVAGLLHPWHGALLIVVILGAEMVLPRERPWTLSRLALASLTAALAAMPLVYYVLLGRIDLDWGLARAASKHAFPLGAIVLELAPLLAPALLAYRRRPRTFLSAATLAWPVAAFAIFGLSTTRFAATPLHAFQGVTLPLSVLAVATLREHGLRRLPRPAAWGSALVVAFTVPGTVWQLENAYRMTRPQAGDASFITHSERRALDYLARYPRPGGVISRLYLGQLVPGLSARHTFVGDCLWSQPACADRQVAVHDLFAGRLPPPAARALVRSHRARFLLADCRPGADLAKLLGRLVVYVHHFGCATVYEVG
jgi:hypothetical protein